jgi:hypothetical protein
LFYINSKIILLDVAILPLGLVTFCCMSRHLAPAMLRKVCCFNLVSKLWCKEATLGSQDGGAVSQSGSDMKIKIIFGHSQCWGKWH